MPHVELRAVEDPLHLRRGDAALLGRVQLHVHVARALDAQPGERLLEPVQHSLGADALGPVEVIEGDDPVEVGGHALGRQRREHVADHDPAVEAGEGLRLHAIGCGMARLEEAAADQAPAVAQVVQEGRGLARDLPLQLLGGVVGRHPLLDVAEPLARGVAGRDLDPRQLHLGHVEVERGAEVLAQLLVHAAHSPADAAQASGQERRAVEELAYVARGRRRGRAVAPEQGLVSLQAQVLDHPAGDELGDGAVDEEDVLHANEGRESTRSPARAAPGSPAAAILGPWS